jgi:hypothetical protein
MNKTWQVVKYLTFDILAAAISWIVFFIYRKAIIEPQRFGIDIPIEFNHRFYMGLIFIPVFWITIYYITGFYKNIYRRSRLLELWKTFTNTLVGVIVIFFTLILDDFIDTYKNYYQLFFTLFLLHFSLTYIFRLIITTQTVHKIHRRKIGFNTLIIGSNEKALNIFNEMNNQKYPAGNLFVGFVGLENNNDALLSKYLPKLGNFNKLTDIIQKNEIEEVVIAIETIEHKRLSEILTVIENRQITIWGIPDLYDFLSGMVKTNTIYGSPLIKISNGLMPGWQENTKRLLDVTLSLVASVILLPVLLRLPLLLNQHQKAQYSINRNELAGLGNLFAFINCGAWLPAQKTGPLPFHRKMTSELQKLENSCAKPIWMKFLSFTTSLLAICRWLARALNGNITSTRLLKKRLTTHTCINFAPELLRGARLGMVMPRMLTKCSNDFLMI